MKRKILTQIFALGMLLQMATACQTPDAGILEEGKVIRGDGQWLAYNETQCADPWGYCNKDPQKVVCVKEHLANLGVNVLEATVSGQLHEMTCMACQCTTGRVFKVKVHAADVEKVVAVGFKKI